MRQTPGMDVVSAVRRTAGEVRLKPDATYDHAPNTFCSSNGVVTSS